MKINWKKTKDYLLQPVVIDIDDHALGEDIVPCRCIGWLSEITTKRVTIIYWDVLSTCDRTRAINIESISLSKKSITAIYPLKVIKLTS